MVRIRKSLLSSGRLVLSKRGKVTSPAYHVQRPHGTADWLIIHCISGNGRIRTSKGEMQVPGGTCILYPEGCPHDYAIQPGQSIWEIQWAHFLPRDGWQRLLAWPSPIDGPGVLNVLGETRSQIEQALDIMVAAAAGPWPGDQELARSALEVALRLFERGNAAQGHAFDARIRDAMDVIASDPRIGEDLPRLARTAGVSISRFSHLFREHAGMSPGRWSELVRLRRAASVLLSSGESVAKISHAAGFNDPLYFSARFRKHFGMSPRAYRDNR